MSGTDLRETMDRWRKAVTDDEKASRLNRNVRLFLVCGGTLVVVLLALLGVRQASHSAPSYKVSPSSSLDDISNSTLGVSPQNVGS